MTSAGMLSLTVEAKANETFGEEILENWLVAGKTTDSIENRKARFDYVRTHLPPSESFLPVRYQLLHRSAASVIEAKRFGFQHAAFVVQAFNAPTKSFDDYSAFCRAMNVPAKSNSLVTAAVDNISLSVGWADCSLATNDDVAATA